MSYALPYDPAAIAAWGSEIRRAASKLQQATTVAHRQGGARIQFSGPAADRYTQHLGKQTTQMQAAAAELSAASSKVAELVAEAERLNRAYIAMLDAAEAIARQVARVLP